MNLRNVERGLGRGRVTFVSWNCFCLERLASKSFHLLYFVSESGKHPTMVRALTRFPIPALLLHGQSQVSISMIGGARCRAV